MHHSGPKVKGPRSKVLRSVAPQHLQELLARQAVLFTALIGVYRL